MKLTHQINLAFGLSLALILSITGVIIHYVLLDHFIGTQKEDMKTLGAAMSATLIETNSTPSSIGETVEMQSSLIPVAYAGIEAIVSDEHGNIVSGTLPVSDAISIEAIPLQGSITASTSLQSIWDGNDSQYLVEVKSIPQGKLTLFTPMSKIKSIERALLGRLILVFVAVGAIMFLLSLFITKKLIQPLMNLREELKKVKDRQFTDVKLIQASGEIGAVAQTVFEMADELNKFNLVQKQFFQNASHELKTPLMSISGYAEGIKDGIFEGENVRKGLDIILNESGRLGKIVTEMTLLAKLDSEEDIFQPTRVRLKDLLTETVERVNPMLVKKGLSLHINCPQDEELIIMADKDKILQALLNVVTNAARYANEHIYVTASIDNGRTKLTVSDDGPGIPEEILTTLFHRFVKGKDGESGLGLAIARAIVERCGGLIQADNRKEGGAVISFGFPVVCHK
ncbi:signal transduction histidine kinase [Paenibacillus anaericanus]|uniref:sensor histidine kinase n=1 Tax=Paenibacillus anaericanus TaxID=170367 RepID=UPI00278B5429|nr:HAMP domain-containing sensor histidine kinase [Paenibacillus anaericanus]MDQ0087915.1 signal transduction histidine kinase [Paenibacillus anaericanus]